MKKLFVILCSIVLMGLVSCEAPYMDEQFEQVIDTTNDNVLKFTIEDVTFNMIFVEGGTFKMGGTKEQGGSSEVFDNEKPVHDVTVSSFYIAETEVTQALWEKVMHFKPTRDGSKWQDQYGLGANYPAYYISWNDCQEFIVKLNELTGECFRLPTEAEWEYAARGGNKTKGYKYSGSNSIGEVARYDTSKPYYVARYKHNELGVYDMSGNVWEYCSDYYGAYTEDAQVDPTGAALGSNRVIRGGSWYYDERDCRVARRQSVNTDSRWNDHGLRLVLATKDSCTITTVANDNKMGTIIGGGKYHIGDTIVLRATPKSGYQFVRWGDDNNDNPLTITVTRNETFTAYFESTNEKVSGVHNEHTFVDLGLPSGIFWATCNIGAETPSNTGDYFAWAETSPKEIYNLSTYIYSSGGTDYMTKYCCSDYGQEDYKDQLELADDAAYVNWGGSWRTPTNDEFEELIDNCTWTITTRSGITGYNVEGKNGNAIFLPAAGIRSESRTADLGIYGRYWSSNLRVSSSESIYAYRLSFSASSISVDFMAKRQQGCPIRPVCPKWAGTPYYTITVFSNDETMGTVTGGGSYEVDSKVEINAIPNAGYVFVDWSDGNTSNPRTITVRKDITLTANFASATSIVSGVHNGYDYVDLGLSSGLLWATHNVGAIVPEECGNYYAWGETSTKTTYNWQNYKYCKDSPYFMTKYSTYSNFGIVDNKTSLDLSDDAAHVHWGGDWRIPTKKELEELHSQCSWVWTTQNNITGYRVIGPNGNSIFLPSTGYYNEDGFNQNFNKYSSSTLIINYPHEDYTFQFKSSWIYDILSGNGRWNGTTIRPVHSSSTNSIYTIVGQCNDVSFGSISGGGTYESGVNVTLTATAATNCQFISWSDGNKNASRSINVTEDATYIAFFMPNPSHTGTNNGYDYVDLGLPSGVLWATHNIGATNPEDYGDNYAWGETTTKTTYTLDTYKYYNGSQYTKYSSTDNKTTLEASDDAAAYNWGGNWRMPTSIEQEELLKNCTFIWTWMKNDTYGYVVVGPNGNSIFLPLGDSTYDWLGLDMYDNYLSSSIDESSMNSSCYVIHLEAIEAGGGIPQSRIRYDGYPVRPVCSIP